MKIRFPIPNIHNVFLYDFALHSADYTLINSDNKTNAIDYSDVILTPR